VGESSIPARVHTDLHHLAQAFRTPTPPLVSQSQIFSTARPSSYWAEAMGCTPLSTFEYGMFAIWYQP
jgi:hypothetical protein